jgi:hypothetical protein
LIKKLVNGTGKRPLRKTSVQTEEMFENSSVTTNNKSLFTEYFNNEEQRKTFKFKKNPQLV